jgi:hypothetical protein
MFDHHDLDREIQVGRHDLLTDFAAQNQHRDSLLLAGDILEAKFGSV